MTKMNGKKPEQPAQKFQKIYATTGNCRRCGIGFDMRFRGNVIRDLAFCVNCLAWAVTLPRDIDEKRLVADLMRGAVRQRRKVDKRPHPGRRQHDVASDTDHPHDGVPNH